LVIAEIDGDQRLALNCYFTVMMVVAAPPFAV